MGVHRENQQTNENVFPILVVDTPHSGDILLRNVFTHTRVPLFLGFRGLHAHFPNVSILCLVSRTVRSQFLNALHHEVYGVYVFYILCGFYVESLHMASGA